MHPNSKMKINHITPVGIGILTTIIVAILLVSYFSRQPTPHTPSGEQLEKMAEEATIVLRANHPDSALHLFTPVINSYMPEMEPTALRAIARALNNAASIQIFNCGNYVLGYSYLLRAKDIAERTDYADLLPYISLAKRIVSSCRATGENLPV